jgi:hypothetical protein
MSHRPCEKAAASERELSRSSRASESRSSRAEPSESRSSRAERVEVQPSRAERVEVERRARQGVLVRWSDRGLPSLRATEQRHETETVEAVRVWGYSATGKKGGGGGVAPGMYGKNHEYKTHTANFKKP